MRLHRAMPALAGLLLAATAGAAPAASIVSTFDSDAEGWTGDGMNIGWVQTGGNPGGYLTAADSFGDFGVINAPAAFQNIALRDGGVLSFDYLNAGSTNDGTLGGFGEVTLSNGSTSASVDIAPTQPSNEWQTATVALTAAEWGQTQATWEALIANVTSLTIETEFFSGIEETAGIDNVRVDLAPIPLPTAAPLLLAGLGALSALRLRRRAA